MVNQQVIIYEMVKSIYSYLSPITKHKPHIFPAVHDNMIDKSISENEDKLKDTEKNLAVAKTRCGDVFPHEDELRDKQHRFKELSLELAVNDDSDNRMAAISADESENNTTSRGRR